MRITTWNVNGIRTIKPLRETLDSLNSDIICLQETKVSSADLDESIAFVPGYHSFFSICETRPRYNGVVTYCRKSTATPIDATNDLNDPSFNPTAAHLPETAFGKYKYKHCYIKDCPCEGVLVGQHTFDAIKGEGRCIITNHSSFIVINVYIPALSTGESDRHLFKLQFLHALQIKMNLYFQLGYHVILLGDLNISPSVIDSAEMFNNQINYLDKLRFLKSPSRAWLNRLISDDFKDVVFTSFVDVYRKLYPSKTNAYTCWSEATKGRQLNYGVRIDLFITNSDFFEQAIEDSQIWPHVMGSDHCPVTIKLTSSNSIIKQLHNLPKTPPSFCSEFLPQFMKRQQSILKFFQPYQNRQLSATSSLDTHEGNVKIGEACPKVTDIGVDGIQSSLDDIDIPSVPNSPPESPLKDELQNTSEVESQNSNCRAASDKHIIQKKPRTSVQTKSMKPRKKILKSKQLTFPSSSSFIGKKPAVQNQIAEFVNLDEDEQQQPSQDGIANTENTLANDLSLTQSCMDNSFSNSQSFHQSTSISADEKRKESAKAWRKLLSGPPEPPKCKHGNPCVLKTVTKPGDNKGKTFFSCAFPHGTGKDSNCNFFKWAPFEAKYLK